MGVASFYRWLVNKYPKVVVKVIEQGKCVDSCMSNPNGIEYDNLYLDMNGIIHSCFHPQDHDNSSLPTTFEDVFCNVFEYIDRLFSIVRPRKLLYMAIDGVAPRAKMNQQRSRRFRTAKDYELHEAEEDRLRKQFEMEGKQVLPKQESQVWDSNVITPGTEFMDKLSKALQLYINSRITSNEAWRNIQVILSDANVPGEGEHKIMSFIRKQRSLPGYDPNSRHCLYGLDADLIMLAMATHEPHFSILREEQQPICELSSQSREWFKNIKSLHKSETPFWPAVKKSGAFSKPLEFLHIWILREYIELDMKIQDPPKNISFDLERIVDDFIFMCFFAGNDFLPHMPSLEIHEGAIDLLMTAYKKEFKNLGGYLIDVNRVEDKKAAFVKPSRVEKFILIIGTYEEKIFKKRSEIKEKKLRRLLREYKKEEENSAFSPEFDKENSSGVDSSVHLASNGQGLSEILENTKDLKEQLKSLLGRKADLFKNGQFSTDTIKLGTAGWKQRYYKLKFLVESPTDIESKRREIVHKYTEGLLWVLRYYFSGVPSWTWFYPYHYGPFASDLKGIGQVKVNFQKGAPFKPFDQLLGVLPPRSTHALPKAYGQLMVDQKSSIIDFYPLDFEVDTEGKRFMWQGISKLPFIEERRLLDETRQLEKQLSEKEAIRNSVKVDRLFVGITNKVALKICSLSNANDLLDMSISNGIGGILRLCNEGVEKVNPEIEVHESIQEDFVLCAYYELPVGGVHTPRLLSGVNLPSKKIFENDIMETLVWHECQGPNIQRTANSYITTSKWPANVTTSEGRRRFPSNSSPPVIYKPAATADSRSLRFSSSNNGFNSNQRMNSWKDVCAGTSFNTQVSGGKAFQTKDQSC